MGVKKFILRVLRKIFMLQKKSREWFSFHVLGNKKDAYKEQLYEKYVELFDQEANDYCRQLLESGKPCMISKFGTTELHHLIKFESRNIKSYTLQNYLQFITGRRDALWWGDVEINGLCSHCGFFPNEPSLLKDFYDVYYKTIQNVDVLGSYLENEILFKKELKRAKRVNVDGYYAPFMFKNPWTLALKNKKVLVLHPFEKSIQNQYKKKRELWKDADVLPDFELITIKAEQTLLDQPSEYNNWFEALEAMKEKIKNTDFDVALIGAGAYGMPLAAYVKELGKQSIHLAGWTQILFGIKGKRWVDMPSINKLMNEHWVHPLPEEAPQNFKKVEDGAYW